MDDANDDEDESEPYTVGYGKPPVETRWKPGQSGNTGGRPKRKKASDSLYKVVNQTVQMRINGQVKRVPLVEALASKMVESAFAGNRHDRNEVLRIAESFDQDGEDEEEVTPEASAARQAQIDDYFDFRDIREAFVELGLFELDENGRTKVTEQVFEKFAPGWQSATLSSAVSYLLANYLVGTEPL